jgi:hypothetical protein
VTTIAEVRTQLADALSALDGFDVLARDAGRNPKPLAGFVVLGPMEPTGFGGVVKATVTAVIYLGPDRKRADELLEEWGPVVVRTVSVLDLGAVSVQLNPEQLLVGDPPVSSAYAVTVSLSVEVE